MLRYFVIGLVVASVAARSHSVIAAVNMEPSFRWIGSGRAYDVSADGRVVVGTDGAGQAYRWTEGSGVQSLGYAGVAFGTSADGSVIVGWGSSSGGVRWTSATGAVTLTFDGSPVAQARKVSADGSVVVGFIPGAFRWTASTGVVPVTGTSANAVTPDAQYIGVNGPPTRLGGTSGPVNLGALPGGSGLGFVYDISDSGSTIVGESRNGSNVSVPFRWTEAGGMAALPPLVADGLAGRAWAVSADGDTVVGAFASQSLSARAFIWTETGGTSDLRDVLAGLGLDMTGVTLRDVYGISADGRTVVGEGNRGAFIAVIPEPASTVALLATALLIGRRRRVR